MMMLKYKHPLIIVLVTVGLLLVPLVAMQFSEDVNWSLSDFVIMGALLLVAGTVLDMILTKIRSRNRRLLAISLLAVLFLYIWAELAVGIFTHLGS